MYRLLSRFSNWDSSGFIAILAGAVMAVILILLVTILPAKASQDEDSKMTKIRGAKLICGDKGGAFFINPKAKKVWQGDLGEPDGIEHTITKFQLFRCPNTYEIHSYISMMGERLNFIFKSHGCGATKRVKLDVEAYTDQDKESFQYTCQSK